MSTPADRWFTGTRPTHKPAATLGTFLDDLDSQPWAADALCAQTDPEAFYPDKGGSTREAKAVCAKCPVRAECLDYALEHAERFGIWGGYSERERRAIAKGDYGTCALPECGAQFPKHYPTQRYCRAAHQRAAHRAAVAARRAAKKQDVA